MRRRCFRRFTLVFRSRYKRAALSRPGGGAGRGHGGNVQPVPRLRDSTGTAPFGYKR